MAKNIPSKIWWIKFKVEVRIQNWNDYMIIHVYSYILKKNLGTEYGAPLFDFDPFTANLLKQGRSREWFPPIWGGLFQPKAFYMWSKCFFNNETGTYIHDMYKCIWISTHIHEYVHTYTNTYTHTRTRTHIHEHIHTYTNTYTHSRIHKHIHTYKHTQIHTHIHEYIHTYTNTYTYTWICTHIH